MSDEVNNKIDLTWATFDEIVAELANRSEALVIGAYIEGKEFPIRLRASGDRARVRGLLCDLCDVQTHNARKLWNLNLDGKK